MRVRARSAALRSPRAARRGLDHVQGLCCDTDPEPRPPHCQGALCWLWSGVPCTSGAAGAGLDTPVRLYLFVLLLCSFLNQVLPSAVPVMLWAGNARAGHLGEPCCRRGSCPWVAQQLCHRVVLLGRAQAVSAHPRKSRARQGLHSDSKGSSSAARGHFRPMCHPLACPIHTGLNTGLLLQSSSAPCAMLLFPRKHHFDKSWPSFSSA